MKVDPGFISYALDNWKAARRNRQSRWFRVILAIKPDGDDLIECLIAEIDRNPVGLHDVLKAVTGENPTESKSIGHWAMLGADWKAWWAKKKEDAQ